MVLCFWLVALQERIICSALTFNFKADLTQISYLGKIKIGNTILKHNYIEEYSDKLFPKILAILGFFSDYFKITD